MLQVWRPILVDGNEQFQPDRQVSVMYVFQPDALVKAWNTHHDQLSKLTELEAYKQRRN